MDGLDWIHTKIKETLYLCKEPKCIGRVKTALVLSWFGLHFLIEWCSECATFYISEILNLHMYKLTYSSRKFRLTFWVERSSIYAAACLNILNFSVLHYIQMKSTFLSNWKFFFEYFRSISFHRESNGWLLIPEIFPSICHSHSVNSK